MERGTALGRTALVQAAYYVLTGIWPILSIGTFMAVTGPKHDIWLVQTFGALIVVVGAVIGLAALRGDVDGRIRSLAVGSAACLALCDVIFATKRVIGPVYYLDAGAEAALIVGWMLASRLQRRAAAATGHPRPA